MKNEFTFKRYEMKYLMSEVQKEQLLAAVSCRIRADNYGKSTICNVYFDTPDYLLIRRSIEKPIYKEKLRIRSYGVADEESSVFVELKKKYKGPVYKRRFSTAEEKAMRYLVCGADIQSPLQITREINYFMQLYPQLAPAAFISYEREAYYAVDDSDFRLTFDTNILWRGYDLSLCDGIYGEPILGEGMVLMELKTGTALPLWITHFLSENRIFRTSFSKYGSAYECMQRTEARGSKRYA